MHIKEQLVNALNHSFTTNIVKDGDGYLFNSDAHLSRCVYWGNNGNQIFSRNGYTVIVTFNRSLIPGNISASLNCLTYLIDPEGNCTSYIFEPSFGEFVTGQGDDHRRPAVSILHDGRIIVVQEKGKGADVTITGDNNHNTNLTVWVTKKPYDLSTFERVLDIPCKSTYLFLHVRKDFVLVTFRNFVTSGGLLCSIKMPLTFDSYAFRAICTIHSMRYYPWNSIQQDNAAIYVNVNVRSEVVGSFFFYPAVLKSYDGETWSNLQGTFSRNIAESPITYSEYVGHFLIDKSINSVNIQDNANSYNYFYAVTEALNGSVLLAEDYFTIAAGQPRKTERSQIVEVSKQGDVYFHKLDFIENRLPWANTPLPNNELSSGIEMICQSGSFYYLFIRHDFTASRISLFKSRDLKTWEGIKNFVSESIEAAAFLTTTSYALTAKGKVLILGGTGPRGGAADISNSFYIEQIN